MVKNLGQLQYREWTVKAKSEYIVGAKNWPLTLLGVVLVCIRRFVRLSRLSTTLESNVLSNGSAQIRKVAEQLFINYGASAKVHICGAELLDVGGQDYGESLEVLYSAI